MTQEARKGPQTAQEGPKTAPRRPKTVQEAPERPIARSPPTHMSHPTHHPGIVAGWAEGNWIPLAQGFAAEHFPHGHDDTRGQASA
eukprot:2170528-Pyramimonas_sp.AAC.1